MTQPRAGGAEIFVAVAGRLKWWHLTAQGGPVVREQPRRTGESLDESAAPKRTEVVDHHSAVTNPHSWMHPVLRARWKQQQGFHRILDVRRVELDQFEKDVLVPQMYDRVTYMRQLFERIRDIAASPETDYRIAPQVRELAPDYADGAGGDSTSSYLKEVVRQTNETFIEPLKKIEREHKTVATLPQMYRFFNDVRYICQMVISLENILFKYKATVTLVAIDKATGKRVKDEQKTWDIILTPFELTLGELKRVAETSDGSIEHWSKKQEEAKKPFLEYVAAATNAATSRRSIFIQLLTIALSVCLSSFFLTARDPFSLKKENMSLRDDLDAARAEAARLAAEVQRLRNQLPPAP